MSQYKEKEDKIQAYMVGKLTKAERTAFEKEMTADAALYEDLRFAMDIRLALTYPKELDALIVLRQIMAEEGAVEPDTEGYKREIEPMLRKMHLRKWGLQAGIGAVVLAIVSSVIWLFFSQNAAPNAVSTNTISVLVQPHIVPYRNLYGARLQDNATANDLLKQGMAAYDAGRYTEAAQLLGQLTDADAPYADFYVGISEMLKPQPDWQRAETRLKTAAAKQNLATEAAQWMRVLCLIQSDKRAEAADILRGGNLDKNTLLKWEEYRDSATVVLQKLNDFKE